MMKVLVVSLMTAICCISAMQAQIPDAAVRTGQGVPSAMHHIWLSDTAGQQIYYGQLLHASDSGVVVTDRRGYGTDTLFYAYEHLGLIRCRKSSSFFYKALAGAGIGMLTGVAVGYLSSQDDNPGDLLDLSGLLPFMYGVVGFEVGGLIGFLTGFHKTRWLPEGRAVLTSEELKQLQEYQTRYWSR